MTCARRPAAARKPAPRTIAAGSRRSDAPTRRSRARLSVHPALALLLGALGLFAAAPAQAQDDPTDASLSGLTASTSDSAAGTFAALTLTPAFAAATTSYAASAANSATHLKLTPTATNSAAKVTVGRQTDTLLSQVASGTASEAIALGVGANAITVKVTATDGTTTRTYTVTVTRQPAVPAALANFRLTPGIVRLDASWDAPPQDTAATGYDVHYTSAAPSSVADGAAASGSDPSAAWVDAGHSGTDPRITLSSLTAAAWRVRVRTVNSAGNGPWSVASANPQTTVRFASTSLTVGEGVGDAEITLVAGHANAFTGALRYSRSTSPDPLDGPPAAYTFSASDTTLAVDIPVDDDDRNETDAVVTIRLAGGGGLVPANPSSMTLTILDDDPPSAPSNLVAAGGAKQFRATWTKRSDDIGPVTAFQFRYRWQTAPDRAATTDNDPATGWVAVVVSADTGVKVNGILTYSRTVAGLGHSESFYLQVRATDGTEGPGGFPVYGPWSDRGNVTTDANPASGSATPQPPGSIGAKSDSDGGLTVSWAAESGGPCYDVRHRKEGGSWSTPANVCALTWTGSSLPPGDYEAQVRSVYTGGNASAWSDAVSAIVKGGVLVTFDFTTDASGTGPSYNRRP